MNYKQVVKGEFISRPNRFIANVKINGKTETVHVKNTGRCKELLIPKRTVYLSAAENQNRKTKYDLIAVEKDSEGVKRLINMDSQITNDAAEEWLKKGNMFSDSAKIRRESTFGRSRFDFYIEDGNERTFLEVKGVTLESEGRVYFPDAPTERGVKHIRELIGCLSKGYSAQILFVVQMGGVLSFSPNDVTHPEFGDALREAEKAGVKITAVECDVAPDSIEISGFVDVVL